MTWQDLGYDRWDGEVLTDPPLSPPDSGIGEPQPGTCQECGAPVPWAWVERKAEWYPPAHTCGLCRARAATRKAEAEAADRIRYAGIPERYQGWNWEHRAGLEATDQPRRLGVFAGNAEAVALMQAWRPDRGSVWLWGGVGAGKTLLLCMVACDLLREPLTWEEAPELPREQGYPKRLRRTGGWSVVLTTEAELIGGMTRRRKFRDDEEGIPNPLDVARRCGVLLLDDLGRSMEKGAQEVIEEVVDKRYRAGRPILVSSNKAPEGLEGLLGARVVSRLQEMACGRVVEVRGSWRAR